MKIYLAGPMTGIAYFNFPEFKRVTALLRGQGWEVVSPAEEDYKHGVGQEAEKIADGDATKLTETWGDILARDVKLLADGGINGIVFLPNWQRSRGVRLEATVGLLCGLRFYEWNQARETAVPVNSDWVAHELYQANIRKVA